MSGARSAVAIVAAVAALLALPTAASAHGSSSYVATVRGIVPPLAGVSVRIERGFRIVLTSRGRRPVVVFGPGGAPYLRFDRAGVEANLGRPGRPSWTVITPRRTFAWPVERAPSASATPPLVVRREPGKSHHLRGWRVPLRAGGRSYAIVGSLDYRVSGTGLDELLFPLVPVPLLLLLAAGIVRRARR
jgi:hypothetical protein